MQKIYFITGNTGKFTELQQKLSPLNITVVQQDLGYPEIQAETLEAVAEYGLKHVQQQFSKPFILEDAGLFIHALKGFPGVYSKYVYYTIGLDGILRLMHQQKNRQAYRYRCFRPSRKRSAGRSTTWPRRCSRTSRRSRSRAPA